MIEIISKKQGMKSLIKKLVELENLTACSGIHKKEGYRIVRKKNRNNKINIATLAWQLEQFASWIQTKNAPILDATGKMIGMIPMGARLTRQARPFISFYRVPDVFAHFKQVVRNLVRDFIIGRKMKPKAFMQAIADSASSSQKFIIANKKSAPNKPITEAIKGFNHPLKETGRLFNSIRGSVKSLKRSVRAVLKNSDIAKVNQIYKDLGGKS